MPSENAILFEKYAQYSRAVYAQCSVHRQRIPSSQEEGFIVLHLLVEV